MPTDFPELVPWYGAIETRSLAIGTTTTAVLRGPARVLLHNAGPDPVYLGGPDVSAASGFPVPLGSGDPLELALPPGTTLYAVSAGSSDLRVMRLG